jgi:co-chaperonin GroES (HSP10)
MPAQNWTDLSQFALELAHVSAKAILPFFRRDTPVDVKAGDKILFGKYSGTDIKVDGEEYLILREDEVLAVVG